MKSKITIFLIVCLLLSTVFMSCGEGIPETGDVSENQTTNTVETEMNSTTTSAATSQVTTTTTTKRAITIA